MDSEGSCTSELQVHPSRPPRSNGVFGDDWITDKLSYEGISQIPDSYNSWRSGNEYSDVPGFCKSASLEENPRRGHVLTPGRYVGAEVQANDGEPLGEKMTRLIAHWRERQAEAARLDAAIEENLSRLGFPPIQ